MMRDGLWMMKINEYLMMTTVLPMGIVYEWLMVNMMMDDNVIKVSDDKCLIMMTVANVEDNWKTKWW